MSSGGKWNQLVEGGVGMWSSWLALLCFLMLTCWIVAAHRLVRPGETNDTSTPEIFDKTEVDPSFSHILLEAPNVPVDPHESFLRKSHDDANDRVLYVASSACLGLLEQQRLLQRQQIQQLLQSQPSAVRPPQICVSAGPRLRAFSFNRFTSSSRSSSRHSTNWCSSRTSSSCSPRFLPSPSPPLSCPSTTCCLAPRAKAKAPSPPTPS